MLLWVCLVIAAAVAAVISLARKRWAEAVALPFIPLVACFATLNVTPYVEYPQDYIHFRMMRSSYEATIARQPADGHRFAEFNWGGMLFASKGVVYDETDEVRLPYGHQSADWKRRMRATDLTCRGDGPIGDVRPLGDHYYVTSFGC